MKAKVLKFGLVGCGAMGRVIARHLLSRWKRRARWVALCDVSRQKAAEMAIKARVSAPVTALSKLVSASDWVVEAASAAAVPEILRQCIARKKNLLVMSSGGLLSCSILLRRAEEAGIRIMVPSGAIAGLDAIKAARLGRIREASITTRKPPKGLAGAPYFQKRGVDISGLKEETKVFEGNATEAIAGFPANVNVAATLGLVTGLGPSKTRVTIIADPVATSNTHEIIVKGSSGTIRATVANVPNAANPKTSDLAVLAACAAIDDIFSSIRIGT